MVSKTGGERAYITALPVIEKVPFDPESAEISRDLFKKVAKSLSLEDRKVARGLMNGVPADEAATALQLKLPAYYQRVRRLRKRVRSILNTLSGIA